MRLVEVGVAAQTGQIDRQRVAAPGGRRDRVVDRVVDQAGHDLADDPLAALADQQRIAEIRIARQHQRIGVDVADFGDAHLFVAVVREQPGEAGQREPEADDAALGLLGELADVADVAPEQVERRR